MPGKKRETIVFFIIAAVLALDQLTKLLVTQKFFLYQSIPLIKGVFHLTLVHNRGAAFGLFRYQTQLFIYAALLAVVLICLNLKKSGQGFLRKTALAFIAAGALGNLIDRVRFGYVIDFLDFRVWPVFNVADSAITIGVVLLGYLMLRAKSAKKA